MSRAMLAGLAAGTIVAVGAMMMCADNNAEQCAKVNAQLSRSNSWDTQLSVAGVKGATERTIGIRPMSDIENVYSARCYSAESSNQLINCLLGGMIAMFAVWFSGAIVGRVLNL